MLSHPPCQKHYIAAGVAAFFDLRTVRRLAGLRAFVALRAVLALRTTFAFRTVFFAVLRLAALRAVFFAGRRTALRAVVFLAAFLATFFTFLAIFVSSSLLVFALGLDGSCLTLREFFSLNLVCD